MTQVITGTYQVFSSEFAEEVHRQAVEHNFSLMLKDLKEAGYIELWVGECPPGSTFSPDWDGRMDMIFAVAPGKEDPRINHWPAVWHITRKYFQMGCGNWHQAQLMLRLPSHLMGRHIL